LRAFGPKGRRTLHSCGGTALEAGARTKARATAHATATTDAGLSTSVEMTTLWRYGRKQILFEDDNKSDKSKDRNEQQKVQKQIPTG
jgi:hypothetical protein